MKRTVILAVVSICSCLPSCKNQTKQSNKTALTSSLSEQLEKLEKRTDSNWATMMDSDRLKFDNMKRLVAELKLVEGSNQQNLEKILLKINAIDSVRYSQRGISAPGVIDRFDAVTNDIWMALRQEVSSTKKASEFQIISNILIPEIQQADDSVLFYRKDYDRTVDSLNLFVRENKKRLRKEVPGIDTVKPLPVFRVVQ